jgi:DNA-binding GntR family transcriptional regulator
MRSIDQHARIIDALRTHDPVFAERLVVQSVDAFLKETRKVVRAVDE